MAAIGALHFSMRSFGYALFVWEKNIIYERSKSKIKALVCEMCTSNDVIKQDGYFVCQNCGTKYTVEEARKIMLEGPVAVDETYKIDNYYKMAENAKDSGNNEEAEEYCNKILEIDSNNWKAWLLSGKTKGWQSTLENLRLNEALNCFTNAIDNVTEDEEENVKHEISNEIINLSIALLDLCFDNYIKHDSFNNEQIILNCIKMLQGNPLNLLLKCGVSESKFKKIISLKVNNSALNIWNEAFSYFSIRCKNDRSVQETILKSKVRVCLNFIEFAIDLCDNDFDNIIKYKNIIGIIETLIENLHYLSNKEKEANIDLIMQYHQKIKQIDQNYVIPERTKIKKGGCYIATCIYGSYDCPQVWTLRRFRDFTLTKTWYGRTFIKLYYLISPTIVKLLGNKKWFKKIWRKQLDNMVIKLKENGFEDIPYYDR